MIVTIQVQESKLHQTTQALFKLKENLEQKEIEIFKIQVALDWNNHELVSGDYIKGDRRRKGAIEVERDSPKTMGRKNKERKCEQHAPRRE